MLPGFAPITPLEADHDLDGFDCGSSSLDHWLTTWARHSGRVDSARTFVICPEGSRRVIGFHTLAAASASRDEAPKKLVKLAGPHAVPVVLLARLAVHHEFQGRRLSSLLLKDAFARTLQASGHVGAVALMVHAKDDQARSFYEHWGFMPSPLQPLQLFLPLRTIRQAVIIANDAEPRAAGA